MRNTVFTLVIICMASITTFGQRHLRYQDLQFSIGTMNYNGEISTAVDPGTLLIEMRPYAAIDYNYFFGPKFGMGMRLGYGMVTADDANHATPDRGLSFESDVVELNAQMIYHFKKWGKSFHANTTTLYLKASGGATWVHTRYPDDIQFPDGVDIYPGTNGGFNLGLGGGAKFRLSKRSALSVEFMGHFLYSDLIEGFKYRKGFDASDGYGGLRIGYHILLL